jgi:hypothetical protein
LVISVPCSIGFALERQGGKKQMTYAFEEEEPEDTEDEETEEEDEW